MAGPCPPSPVLASWDESSRFYQDFVIDFGSQLPVDPINDTTYFYYYEPTNDGHQGYYFRSRLERGVLYGVCGGTFESGAAWCH